VQIPCIVYSKNITECNNTHCAMCVLWIQDWTMIECDVFKRVLEM